MPGSDTPVVVTGQQIGLLGGPLYTIYKVLGAIYHARQMGGRAVYWLETNDADFNEINHIDYLDAQGQLRTLKWDIHTQGYSCGLIEIDTSLVEILETFFATIRQTDFTPSLKALALECYQPGRTLGEASETLAHQLYSRFEVEVFNPQEKEFRQFSQSILRKEAERTPVGEQCNLFCMVGKQRKAVFKKNGGFQLRDGSEVDLNRHDLVPGVKTRSVCQDGFFHTSMYIAGPGEVKYLAELGPEYRFHNVKPATVQPRMSIYIIEPRIQRLLKRTGLSLSQVVESNREGLLKQVLKTNASFDFQQILQQANTFTGQFMDKLESLDLDSTDIRNLEKHLRQEVRQVCGKQRAREKEKHQQLLTGAASLSDNLKPFGKKQERVFNIFYYLNLFGGKDFIQTLYHHYDPDREILEIES